MIFKSRMDEILKTNYFPKFIFINPISLISKNNN
jgi:hypothetical protein